MTKKVDDIDHALLRELDADARISVSELAKRLAVPRSTVTERIKRLESTGIIRGYTVRRNHAALGEGLTAFVMIQEGPNHHKDTMAFAQHIGRMPGVEEVHVVTGEWDLLVKIRAAGITELYQIAQRLDPQTGVGRTLTVVVFGTVKEPV